MRKHLGFIAVVLSFALLATPLNAASPKAGASCSKVGATSTYAGKKYTCVKLGSKLVWNKGVTVTQTAPKPSATPVATPESKPTPAPTITTPTPTPTSSQITDWKDWEKVYLKIWEEHDNAQSLGSFPFIYKLSPTVNKEKAQESIAAYDKAMKLWMAIIGGTKLSPVIWTIMSEQDYSWWKEVVDQQESSSPNYAWDFTSNTLGHCQLSPRAFCGYGNAYKANTPDYKFLQYNVIGSSYMQSPNANTVNHESVHFYQLSVVQGFPRDTPCWYVEGQASLYGGALEFNLKSDRSSTRKQRNNFKGIVRQYQPDADKFTSNEWVGILQNMYFGHVSCSGQQDYFKYAMGMFIWEHLYEKFGPKVMHEVLLEFKAGKSFSDSIQTQLKLSIPQLNDELGAHLVHVFADGN